MSDYVNNKELYEEICRWKQQIAAEGRQVPMSDQIGLAIMQISKNLSRRFNFSGYSQTWREEMIDDGIEAAVKGLINFDETKYKNPHAYITQACFNAFVQRIKKERTATAAKYKYFVPAFICCFVIVSSKKTDKEKKDEKICMSADGSGFCCNDVCRLRFR